jgi:transposase
MPQMQLPIFPAGLKAITNEIGFQSEDGRVVYFHGHLPVFQHATGDIQGFRLFTSQLIVQGTVSQADIVRAFGVPLITVKRYVKLLREQGSKGFFATPKRRSAPVLTPEVLSKVQALLDAGKGVAETAGETQVRADTLHKAIRAGRLKKNAEYGHCRIEQERAE